MSHFRKDLIFQQATQAAKISYVVNMVSTSYVQVSQKHVMSRIAGKSCHEPLAQFAMDDTLYPKKLASLWFHITQLEEYIAMCLCRIGPIIKLWSWKR